MLRDFFLWTQVLHWCLERKLSRTESEPAISSGLSLSCCGSPGTSAKIASDACLLSRGGGITQRAKS